MSQIQIKVFIPKVRRVTLRSHSQGSEVSLCFPARVNFIKPQQQVKVKLDKKMSYLQDLGFLAQGQGHIHTQANFLVTVRCSMLSVCTVI